MLIFAVNKLQMPTISEQMHMESKFELKKGILIPLNYGKNLRSEYFQIQFN